jgi:hypothetical protein
MPFELSELGFDLFTLARVEGGVAVFGLLDKYVGPAGVVSVKREARAVTVRLREAGDFGAWLERAPESVEAGGRVLPSSAYVYSGGLLRIPRASLGTGPFEVTIRTGPSFNW